MKRQQLADTASLRRRQRAPRLPVPPRLETPVLAGDGVGENILGILNHPDREVVFDAASALST